jgi:hypothetical protein
LKCALVLFILARAGPLIAQPLPLEQRGVALGLFAEDPAFDYRPLLQEIAATGATHVSLIVPHYQHDVRSVRIAPHPRLSPAPEAVRRTLQQARKLGLRVLLFPILRVAHKATVEEWRGSLRPSDPEAWWASYRAFILGFARLAAAHQAEALCVGSELAAMDSDPTRWRPLVAEVRRHFGGRLIYSANWDHFRQVAIWQLVDEAGLSAYFQLGPERSRPLSLQRLVHAWREHRIEIVRWWQGMGKPLVITELGYPSQAGSGARPWDELARQPVDLEEQRRDLEAFFRAWQLAPFLRGVYVWNWYGWGGPRSREYTPRGKPAARVICRWFGAKPGACPTAWGMPWFDHSR